MPNDPPAVYWDACCFIARIKREKGRIEDVEQLTSLAENDKLLIVTSTITIAEVLQEPKISLPRDDGFISIKDYFQHPWIILRAVDRRTAEAAADIRRSYEGLKLPDAIHLATAARWSIKAFHTYDDRLLPKDGKIGTPPLRIITPRYPEDHPLFDTLDRKEEPPILKFARTDRDSETKAITGPDQAGGPA